MAGRPASTRALVLAALTAIGVSSARGQDWLSVEGLLDGEAWQTDTGWSPLTKDAGNTTPQGRLRMWVAAQATPHLSFFVLERVSTEAEAYDRENEADLEQGLVRYAAPTRWPLVVEAGRIASPIAVFARRNLSSTNPLIGEPGFYGTSYPLALMVSGAAARLDYRIAAMDGPGTAGRYVPESGSALRPALGAGVTLMTGFRMGASYSRGPYLNARLEPLLEPGSGWRDFDETFAGFDLEFSRGYLEVNAEASRTEFEVPARGTTLVSDAWYAEIKRTWVPRLFTALRFGQIEEPWVEAIAPSTWAAFNTSSWDFEVGVGYRFDPGTLVKLSYRRDVPYGSDGAPAGYALAAQLSYSFDVTSWFHPRR